MFLPLGTDRPLKRPTLITHALIGVNVAVFIAELFLQRFSPDSFPEIRAALWLHGDSLAPWAFVTYQFLHGGFLHIAGNMLFLFVFGPNLEDRLGRIWFLAFYLVGGALAGAAHTVWHPESPVVGASGAISAVTGAFLVFFPRTIVRVFIFFFIIGVIQIPAAWFIGFAIFRDFFLQGTGQGGSVALIAHLGGYAYGITIAMALLWTGLSPREPYDLFSMGRQARRRRSFKTMTSRGHDPWSGKSPPRPSPEIRRKRDEREDAKADEIAARRADIASMLSKNDVAAAAEAYRALCAEEGPVPLSRDAQLAIANYNYEQGAYQDAAAGYKLFIEKRTTDSETPRIRLLLGLLYARYLNRPSDAKPLLQRAIEQLRDADQKALAESVLKEIAAT